MTRIVEILTADEVALDEIDVKSLKVKVTEGQTQTEDIIKLQKEYRVS